MDTKEVIDHGIEFEKDIEMSKPTFVVIAREVTKNKILIFSTKAKNSSEAEGLVNRYIGNTMTGESYAVRTKYTIYDVEHVQLLEVSSGNIP